MQNLTQDFLDNKVFWVTVLSWAVAQGIKIIIGLFQERKFNFYWLLRTGGMPSAHTAAVVSLSVSLGRSEGFSSPVFALSALFALITMFDAQTWRRYIGVQAGILNRIIDDLHENRKITEQRLKELVGHTPVEVFVGAILGTVISILFYR